MELRQVSVIAYVAGFQWAPVAELWQDSHYTCLLLREHCHFHGHDQVSRPWPQRTLLQISNERSTSWAHTQTCRKQAVLVCFMSSSPDVVSGQSPQLHRSDPWAGLLSRQCQQQLLETSDTVIFIHNRLSCLDFLIAYRRGTLTRVTRLWPALGTLLLLRSNCPWRLFLGPPVETGRVSLGPKQGLHSMAPTLCLQGIQACDTYPFLFPKHFLGQCWKCLNLIKVLFFLHLFFLQNIF